LKAKNESYKQKVEAKKSNNKMSAVLNCVTIENPLFNTLPTAFISLDGRFQAVSSRFTQLMGYDKESLSHITIFNLFVANDLLPMFSHIKQLLSGKVDQWEMNRSCILQDDTSMEMHITMTVVKSDSPLYYVMFLIPKAVEKRSDLPPSHSFSSV